VWPTASSAIGRLPSRKSAGLRNCAAIPICSAGSAGCANKLRPWVTKPAATTLLGLRRSLDDLAANGHSIQPDLMRREDDLPANALLLTQQDLQREFHTARQHAAHPHQVPLLGVLKRPANADPPGIRQAIAARRHLLEMYRRGLPDEQSPRQAPTPRPQASGRRTPGPHYSRKVRKDWPVKSHTSCPLV